MGNVEQGEGGWGRPGRERNRWKVLKRKEMIQEGQVHRGGRGKDGQ